jgi:tRNA dimethylallyltransferase
MTPLPPLIPAKFAIIVVGPTAVGKTDLCIRLAKGFDTDIISADSRQFFREMTIGTAKPGLAERQGVTHHLIDSHSITESYHVAAFEKDALTITAAILRKKEVVILTGGSGLYIKTFCEGLDDIPDTGPAIREKLMAQYQQEGLASLVTQLDILDPVYGQTVDRANPQRIMRALEVCIGTGQPYSSFRKRTTAVRPFHIIKIGLNREREELYSRIDARMDQMLASGLVEEAKGLAAYKEHNALQTVGYKEVFDYLDGQYDYSEMERLLKRNSRRYAKRQLTWFTKDEQIRWFHPHDYEEIVQYIQHCISSLTSSDGAFLN